MLGFDILAPYMINGNATTYRKLGEFLSKALNRRDSWIIMSSCGTMEGPIQALSKLHRETGCLRDEHFKTKWNFAGMKTDESATLYMIVSKDVLSAEGIQKSLGMIPSEQQDILLIHFQYESLSVIADAMAQFDELTKPYRVNHWARRN